MKIYCIIVTYNGMKWIPRCFESLKKSSVPLQILVIDNASTDEGVEYIKRNFQDATVVESKTNLGFCKANNIGIQKAFTEGADYFFLLNQDTWIRENTIAELLQTAVQFKEFGILSPFHVTAEGDKLETQFTEFLSFQYTGMLVSDIFFQQLKQVYETNYIHAASWFISRQCIEKVGAFDPFYFHNGEDDDYMQRVKYFGFKLGLVPAAVITHDGIHKTWDMIEWDEKRNMIFAFQQLKKMSSSFRSNVLVYLKNTFDELTGLLLFRKFKKFSFRFKIARKVVFSLRKVHQSYKSSFREGAFLNL